MTVEVARGVRGEEGGGGGNKIKNIPQVLLVLLLEFSFFILTQMKSGVL